jgi:hypothetical protein
MDQFQDCPFPAPKLRHPELCGARPFLQPPVALEAVRGVRLATMRRLDRPVGLGMIKDHNMDVERPAFRGFIAIAHYRETHPNGQGTTVNDKVGQAGGVQGPAKNPDNPPTPDRGGVGRVKDIEALDR